MLVSKKITSKLVFIFLVSLVTIFISGQVHAATPGQVVFYNTSSDTLDNATCRSGDLPLNPPQTVGNAQTGAGGTFYCVEFSSIADDFETFPMIGGGCPSGKGGFSLGAYGSYCITSIKSTVKTANASGDIVGSPSPSPTPIFLDKGSADDVDAGTAKLYGWIQKFIDLMTGLSGLVIIIMVIVGGIQYSTSGGNPQAASAAKKKIRNAVIALFALIFTFTFLQWLVPGGIFG